MKKRSLFAVILALVLSMSLIAGCGEAKEETKVTPQETPAASAEAPAETTKEAPAAPEKTSEPAKEATVESLLNGYYDSMKDVESISFNMIMDIDMVLGILGEDTQLSMDMDVQVEEYGDNVYLKGTGTMQSLDEAEEEYLEEYYMMEDGELVNYSYDKASDSWSMYTGEEQQFSRDMIPQLDPSLFTLDASGKQYKVSGDIDLNELIETMGETMDDLISEFGDLLESELSGTASVEYYFNKDTNALESVNIDMSKAFEEMFTAMMTAIFEEEDMGDLGDLDLSELWSVTMDAFGVKMENIKINQGKEIVLPEEVKNAEAGGDIILDGDPLSVPLADSFEFKEEYKTFTFEGGTYIAGTTVLSEFLAATGLELDEEDAAEMVEPEDYGFSSIFLNDDYDMVTITVWNLTDAPLPLGDCVILGIDVDDYENEKTDCIIAGIPLGATLDEVIAVLGNPTYGYESEYVSTYTWEDEDYNGITFNFDEPGGASTMIGLDIYLW